MLLQAFIVGLTISIIKGVTLLVCYIGNNSFPHPLSKEEELKYLQILADAKDKSKAAPDALSVEEAKNKLIMHNLRLVAFIANKYEKKCKDNEDLFQIGVPGLIKAISTFKLDKGSNLSTYASRCIHNEILMDLRKNKNAQGVLSLYDPIATDNSGETLDLADVLGTHKDAVHEQLETNLEREEILKIIKELPERERTVISLRYGLIDGICKTQSDVAEIVKVSRSYVSRLENKAIKFVRNKLNP